MHKTIDDNGMPESRRNLDSPVRRHNPIELFITKEQLAAMMQDTLHTIKLNRIRELESPDEQRGNDELIRAREQFLEWILQNPDTHIFTGLYVASEFEDDDEPVDFDTYGHLPEM